MQEDTSNVEVPAVEEVTPAPEAPAEGVPEVAAPVGDATIVEMETPLEQFPEHQDEA